MPGPEAFLRVGAGARRPPRIEPGGALVAPLTCPVSCAYCLKRACRGTPMKTKAALVERWLARVVALRPGEGRALAWSFAYFFCLVRAAPGAGHSALGECGAGQTGSGAGGGRDASRRDHANRLRRRRIDARRSVSCHRPAHFAPRRRPRCGGFAPGVRPWIPGAGHGPGAAGGHCVPGAAADCEFCPVESGAGSPVHRARTRGEVQGEERDRRRRIPRSGCGQRLAVRAAAHSRSGAADAGARARARAGAPRRAHEGLP